MSKPRECFALLWRSRNKLDGLTEHILNTQDCVPMLFRTRSEANRERDKYRNMCLVRKDLRAEPHGWMMPRIVKVKVEVGA